jgi:hypothetical protein
MTDVDDAPHDSMHHVSTLSGGWVVDRPLVLERSDPDRTFTERVEVDGGHVRARWWATGEHGIHEFDPPTELEALTEVLAKLTSRRLADAWHRGPEERRAMTTDDDEMKFCSHPRSLRCCGEPWPCSQHPSSKPETLTGLARDDEAATLRTQLAEATARIELLSAVLTDIDRTVDAWAQSPGGADLAVRLVAQALKVWRFPGTGRRCSRPADPAPSIEGGGNPEWGAQPQSATVEPLEDLSEDEPPAGFWVSFDDKRTYSWGVIVDGEHEHLGKNDSEEEALAGCWRLYRSLTAPARERADARIQHRLDHHYALGLNKGRVDGSTWASAAWRRRWARALGLPDSAGDSYRGLIDATKGIRKALVTAREAALREAAEWYEADCPMDVEWARATPETNLRPAYLRAGLPGFRAAAGDDEAAHPEEPDEDEWRDGGSYTIALVGPRRGEVIERREPDVGGL